MNEQRYENQDDIDFFEVFHDLWQGKITIFIVTFLFSSLGYAHGMISKIQFEVSIEYRIHIYPVDIVRICEGNMICLNESMQNLVLDSLNSEWELGSNGNTVVHRTTEPRELSFYGLVFTEAANSINEIAIQHAQQNINIITNSLDSHARQTETAARSLLAAHGLIYNLQVNGESIVSSSIVRIRETSLSTPAKLFLASLFGFISASGSILILNHFKRNSSRVRMTEDA